MEDKNYNYGVRVGGVGNIIDVSNPDDTGAQGWRYDSDSHTIHIFAPSDYTLMGSTEENKVLVQPERASRMSFNLILMGVSISRRYDDSGSHSAIAIRGGAFCRILLYQNNYVSGTENSAAVNVYADSGLEVDTLLPDRYGGLRAYGGRYAAAIGANQGEAYGNITIDNGTLQLGSENGYGNGLGYGRGSYYFSSGGKIKILGGFISMNDDRLFDGIACSDLEISAGKLDISPGNGAGIALYGGMGQECQVKISGDAEVTVRGSYNSPGIDAFVSHGKGRIVIDGGVVTAYGGEGAAGIGTGYYPGWSDSSVEINGGVVSAYGGPYGAGIGTGEGNASGLDIRINGGIVCAHASHGAAGIGAGYHGKVKNIFISSDAKVIAESHDEEAYDIGGTTDMNTYTGLYSGIYSGKLSGLYQGRLSGLFKGRLGREYTNKVNCKLRGFYTGKAVGTYSGLFVGRFSGGIRPSLYSGLFTGRKGKKFVSKHS